VISSVTGLTIELKRKKLREKTEGYVWRGQYCQASEDLTQDSACAGVQSVATSGRKRETCRRPRSHGGRELEIMIGRDLKAVGEAGGDFMVISTRNFTTRSS
jgi:hypothetical protein